MLDSPFLQKLCEVSLEKPLLLEGLTDLPKALVIAALSKNTALPVVVVTSGEREDKLLQDLEFFHSTNVLELPAWEALPGEEILPSPDIMGKRLEVLSTLSTSKIPPIVLTPLKSLLQKIPSGKRVNDLYTKVHVGEEILFEMLVERFALAGYTKVKLASDKGQFAVRGGIIDIFPVDSPLPYRIEFFGDHLEEIRSYDPMSQTSIQKVKELRIPPGDENALLAEGHLVSLFDYLPKAILVFDDLVKLEDQLVALKSMASFTSTYFINFQEVIERPNLKVYLSKTPIAELSSTITRTKNTLSFEMFGMPLVCHYASHPFQTIEDYFLDEELVYSLQQARDLECIFVTDSEKEEEDIKKKLPNLQIPHSFVRGYLSSGAAILDKNLLVIPYTEFSHRQKMRRTKWRTTYHTPVSDYHAIEPGDLVVHFHNGIGKYLGIEKQNDHLGNAAEFLVLEYAEGSKLFVPISQSHLVSRYIGATEESPTLHKLGGTKWSTAKAKTQAAIIGYAKDLLEWEAKRVSEGGCIYPPDGDEVEEFHESFPYTETTDQLKAIAEIREDMMSPLAMDRLVCGDVGYGKTEVAMRAAFKAVSDGNKQVAVLVPTTVLALQHYETFKERMALFPINVGVISRFQSKKEIEEALEGARTKKLDILIGTHRIISKDVHFQDLGLVIIDEEQRFGVRSKEALKKIKVGVDCLTMTATPIPRTLYLSLIGARKISIINSPPQDRLPIKTIICEKESEIIKNALLRELSREGQAYFIHNRVETIGSVAAELKALLPHARIAVGHGQMDADTLDHIFHEFKQGHIDILVATTIVENGIDIPNANTILIDRADTFGISDLYQLRGRVGRWNKTAYAYFLTEKGKRLPEHSQKRLSALVEASGYGGGMKLAMKDLEIRGAGDILGVQQSGHVSSVGFHLYCKLLKRAVSALKKNVQSTFLETRFEFAYDAKLPSTYIHDSSLRLEFYHRIGESTSNAEIDDIFTELKDRFGPHPLPVTWLYHLSRLRLFANQHKFTQVKFQTHTIIATRLHGPSEEKKSFFFPPVDDPAILEKVILKRLSEEFLLAKS